MWKGTMGDGDRQQPKESVQKRELKGQIRLIESKHGIDRNGFGTEFRRLWWRKVAMRAIRTGN